MTTVRIFVSLANSTTDNTRKMCKENTGRERKRFSGIKRERERERERKKDVKIHPFQC